MKFVTYENREGIQRPGVLFDGEKKIADLIAGNRSMKGVDISDLSSIQALIEGGDKALKAAGEVLDYVSSKKPEGTWVNLEDVKLLAPIPRPIQMRDCLCFQEHLQNVMKVGELLTGQKADTSALDTMRNIPIYYKCNRFGVGGTGQDIEWPDYATMMDYEMEFAAVIGKKGKNIPREEARDYIFGYTIFNDMSARDYQLLEMKGGIGPAKGKDFDNGTILGPCIVTADEIDQDNVAMTVRINGEQVSQGNSSTMYHKFEDCITYISRCETVYPGEIIASGTVGMGCGMERGSMLKENDVIELEVEGIGVLKNRIVAGPKRSNPNAIVQDISLKGKWTNLRHSSFTYDKGLHEIAKGVYAWLLPDGSWGLSNAGLVVDGEKSLLIDTLFDLPLTSEMLDAMAKAEPAAADIDTLVLTHGDGDHWFGNELVKGAEIISTTGAKESMEEMSPAMLAMMVSTMANSPTAMGRFAKNYLGRFQFGGITPTYSTRYVDKKTTLTVGKKTVELIPVGPAHTKGDMLVYMPEERILFTGDIIFAEATPVVHAGPVSRWIDALKLILDLDIDVIVPGHGAITDKRSAEALIEYLELVHKEAKKFYDAGIGLFKAAGQIDLGIFRSWQYPERVVMNMAAVYKELSGREISMRDKLFFMTELGDF